ncbi:hypothetical protein D3C86_1941820 [compost metagenome]
MNPVTRLRVSLRASPRTAGISKFCRPSWKPPRLLATMVVRSASGMKGLPRKIVGALKVGIRKVWT